MALLDRCIFYPTQGGLSDFIVASAAQGYLVPADAGAVNGFPYHYAAEVRNNDNSIIAWEVGNGTWNSLTNTLARTSVIFSSNGGTKVNFTQAPTVALSALSEDFRLRITSPLTLYFRTDGNDANSGFTDSPSGAKATIQSCYDYLTTIDCNGQDVFIEHGNESGGGPTTFSGAGGGTLINTPLVGVRICHIRGNATDRATFGHCTINNDSVGLACFEFTSLGIFKFEGLKLVSSIFGDIFIAGPSQILLGDYTELGSAPVAGAYANYAASEVLAANDFAGTRSKIKVSGTIVIPFFVTAAGLINLTSADITIATGSNLSFFIYGNSGGQGNTNGATFVNENGHTRQVTTGNTHTNTTLDGLGINTSNLDIGMFVVGTGIPVGTTIAAILGPNSVQLSAAATGTAAINVAFELSQGQKFLSDTLSFITTGSPPDGAPLPGTIAGAADASTFGLTA